MVVRHGDLNGPSSDKLLGTSSTDLLYGWALNDNLYGREATDYLYGGSGWDYMDGGTGNDYLFAHEETDDPSAYGSDTVTGGSGRDEVSYVWARSGVFVNLFAGYADEFDSTGGSHRDWLYGIEDAAGSWHEDTICGSDGDNRLYGFGGNDRFAGNRGNDILNGGEGGDYFESHAGNDRLQYTSTNDSTPSDPDYIADFEFGRDKIDLSAIDANLGTSTNEAFKFGGLGAGWVRSIYNQDTQSFWVEANVDDNWSTDLQIEVHYDSSGGARAMEAGDFIL
jgi:Ca2+-binding RTX toxin-like protein